jgi:serine/threonine protein kinase
VKCEISHINKYLKNNSPQCQDLLMKMLDADPDHRPSAKEALEHEWFKQDKEILKELLIINDIMCTNSKKLSSVMSRKMSGQSSTFINMMNSFQVANNHYFRKQNRQREAAFPSPNPQNPFGTPISEFKGE